MFDGTGTAAVDQTLRLRDGRQLGYAEFGDPQGSPAFHFHGFPGTRLTARLHAADAAEAGVRLISPDRPGMGLSDFQARRRIIDWSADVSELADALGIDRFAVLGLSGGGPYALACACEIPQRLTLCGIISGMVPIDYAMQAQNVKRTNVALFRMARRTPWLLHPVIWLALGRISRNEEAMRKTLRASFGELPPQDRELMEDPSIERVIVEDAMEVHRHGSKGCAHELKLYGRDWGLRLEDIACERILLWHGELDVNLPAEAMRRLVAQIPNCKATFYPDEAHLSTMLRHGTEFMAAVREASGASTT